MILSMNTPGDDFIFIDRIISINHSQVDIRFIHNKIIIINHLHIHDFDNQDETNQCDDHETQMTLINMIILININHSHWSR